MPRTRKPKPKSDLHPLCAAVRRLRAAQRLSQEELAAKLNLAPMTVSRFERGVQVPRDAEVLANLRDAAASGPKLASEYLLFQDAMHYAIEKKSPYEVTVSPLARPEYSPEQWELVQIARIAGAHFPKEARAMRKAAGNIAHFVRDVIRNTDFSVPLDDNFYLALEQRIDDSLKWNLFERLKGDTK